MLSLADPPTAIFAGNDIEAMGVYEAARLHRLRIPDDLSVVGFDDLPMSAWVSPPLTTVAQPLAQMAAMATRMVLQTPRGRAEQPGGAGDLAGHPVQHRGPDPPIVPISQRFTDRRHMTRRDDDLDQLAEGQLSVLSPDGDGVRLAVWRDASRPVEERVEDLLRRMTLAEKAGQLRSTWLGSTSFGGGVSGGGGNGGGAGGGGTAGWRRCMRSWLATRSTGPSSSAMGSAS